MINYRTNLAVAIAVALSVVGVISSGCGDDDDHGQTCPNPSQTLCGIDECVDLQTDPEHCGDCERVCDPDQTCVGGQCFSPSLPPLLPPKELHGLHVGGDYQLRWEDPNDDESHYLLERRADTENDYTTLAELDPDTTEYLDQAFSPGAGYHYRLRATRGTDQSAPVTLDSALPLWTYIRIVDYDGVWGGEGSPADELTKLIDSHLTWGLELYGADENMTLVLLGDAYGDGGSIYAAVESGADTTLIHQPELQMDVISTYEDFFDWVVLNHPGQRYVIDYWGHGGGVSLPEGTLGYDDTSGGDGLTPADVATVLGYLTNLTGRQVDLFYLCTCLNGMFENAYEWRHVIRWFVAGETTVGCAVNPLQVLKGHEDMTTQDLAQATVDGFEEWANQGFNVVYSAVNTRHATAMGDLLDQLGQALITYTELGNTERDIVINVAANTQSAGDPLYASYDLAYLDLYDFCDDLTGAVDAPDIDAVCADIMTLLDGQLVLSFVRTDPGDFDEAYGLSIYHPNTRFHQTWPGMPAYYQSHALSQDTHWDDYLLTLYP